MKKRLWQKIITIFGLIIFVTSAFILPPSAERAEARLLTPQERADLLQKINSLQLQIDKLLQDINRLREAQEFGPLHIVANLRVNGSNGPIVVSRGSNVTLSWKSENAETCYTSSSDQSINQKIDYRTTRVGSRVIENIRNSQTFTFRCVNPRGYQSVDNVFVQVGGSLPNVSLEFKVNGQSHSLYVKLGSSMRAAWSSQHAEKCFISSSNSEMNQKIMQAGWEVPATGSWHFPNIRSSQTLTLRCVAYDGRSVLRNIRVLAH